MYASQDAEGQPGVIRHVIWSDVVACPRCAATTTYAELRVRYQPLRFSDDASCAGCGYQDVAKAWSRVTETVKDDVLDVEVTRRLRVPWRIYGRGENGNWMRPATDQDLSDARSVETDELPVGAPVRRLVWGDLHRGGYHLGMTHLHHLYSPRNFRTIAHLWAAIDHEATELRDALRLFVLSYNASHATLMTRVVLKKNSTDFILTGAQSGVMYVSGLPVEKNVLAGLRRKVKVFADAAHPWPRWSSRRCYR
jgi:hypothetical protein